MAAPVGNDFWKQVKGTNGRPPIFATAQDLWLEAVRYFQWVYDNPLYEVKGFAFQGDITMQEFPKMRAMTENAFCLFAGISDDTFRNYKKANPEDPEDFFGVSRRIAAIIYQQKFEGAAADFLNANIIGRELGLVEKTEHTGKDGTPLIPTLTISPIQTVAAPIEEKEAE